MNNLSKMWFIFLAGMFGFFAVLDFMKIGEDFEIGLFFTLVYSGLFILNAFLYSNQKKKLNNLETEQKKTLYEDVLSLDKLFNTTTTIFLIMAVFIYLNQTNQFLAQNISEGLVFISAFFYLLTDSFTQNKSSEINSKIVNKNV